MRVKSHWFRAGTPRGPGDQAGAMGFIAWRAARNMLQRMRQAGFAIDPGPAYFEFLREVLVFLIAVIDRIAFARMDDDARRAFTTALVLHCAGTWEENIVELLGPPPDGPSYRERFVRTADEVVEHYAEFGAEREVDAARDGFSPDFGFLRYFGTRVGATVPPADQRWVLDQVMDIEAPEAVGIVRSAMRNLLSTEPRRQRRAASRGD